MQNIHHGEGHPVDLVLVFGLVLAERRVSLEQLVEHATEAEPVRRGVIGCALGQDLGGHVAMGASGMSKVYNL